MNESIKREYRNDDNESNGDAKFFVGVEVEKTPQYGQKTLFVVDIQDSERVSRFAAVREINHIYLGANKSFHMVDEWEPLVDALLQKGFWVTLDYPVRFHNFIMRSMGNHMRKSRFIPMISVELPNIDVYNYNTTLKIDDLDIDHSNPGIWCHSLHKLQDRDVFTGWDEYGDDEIIK